MCNKEQIEGVARALDTLGTSAIIGLAVGIFGYTPKALTTQEIWGLALSAAFFFCFSFILRE